MPESKNLVKLDSPEQDTKGRQSRIPHISSNSLVPPHSLEEFREGEGRENRKRKLLQLWQSLPELLDPTNKPTKHGDPGQLTPEQAQALKSMYDSELLLRCASPPSGSRFPHIGWKDFRNYSETKEIELWRIFHDELDLDGNGQLDQKELHDALSKFGIHLSSETISEFMQSVSLTCHSHQINFGEFRDFFILLPRKISPAEIYQYYEVRKYMGDDGRGPARVNMEGDVSLSAEDKPPNPVVSILSSPISQSVHKLTSTQGVEDDKAYEFVEENVGRDEPHYFLDGYPALKYLFAGGIAGAVSRTCTAPFDRIKVFLITRPPDLNGSPIPAQTKFNSINVVVNASNHIYSEGGIFAFWTGNGLSVAKIFPESAIKFYVYETAKRAFAKYYDKVEDSRDISGLSRFLSGGIGGISSQLSIYPVETLKTQMMSSAGQQRRTIISAIRRLWMLGGVRAYYRGLTIGLVGVFPYSAIDLSTFEALKQAYQRSTGNKDPGVMTLLACGSISGCVGATSVFPLNLVRTRLQASGSSGHPQIYTGVWDVAGKTWQSGGWRGFYRGLFPTLVKVVPAVSISYVVYEHAKRRLGV